MIATGQVPVEHWHEHIGKPTIADAVLDRLTHGAHRLELKGESMRKLRAAKANLGDAGENEANFIPRMNDTDTPAGIIGIPGGLRSEQVAGFDRNRRLQSSECASRGFGTVDIVFSSSNPWEPSAGSCA
jgi:hypothetical protein